MPNKTEMKNCENETTWVEEDIKNTIDKYRKKCEYLYTEDKLGAHFFLYHKNGKQILSYYSRIKNQSRILKDYCDKEDVPAKWID